MYYLEKQIEHKIIIDKSEFIAIITPIDSILDMPEILKIIKKTYPKATHYCTAYVFENSQGSNDDGEPSGTAGVPMLEVLNKHNLQNCFAVVVRYFGGIKLGAGGLIRAYAKSISQVLIDAPILKKITTTNFEVTFKYDQIGLIDHLFKDFITHKDFLGDVIYELSFTDDLSLIEEHRHLFKLVKEKGTKDILVPWK
ncbi:IMPACT family protein [Acholeplasma laidlawii]|jgi:uncharacterized YigZ family protein|uniref:Impact N-terminal domain-containing protein n=2 Tax=Acholeplasma laidlawii TaxID=2148 RepID=A9NEQ3_ACHLI|nr:YigZ family protein [Acholeplasma laidlawii]ABX80833.1 conserved hypothetical protein [Acholeplasma laidlawii PG-8A]NWH10607.1 YigZ family protein [Acholeplasma laidlawii]NWH11992.1 YigZ family protein [Acholeplasma laidlawii]NWH12599.1 YigZ family protein [Acholeplasma laidlawii]NWH14767.1 YigZ family protein [Acholeplasma laidlawii]